MVVFAGVQVVGRGELLVPVRGESHLLDSL